MQDDSDNYSAALKTTNADYSTVTGYINDIGSISAGTHGEVTTGKIFNPYKIHVEFQNPNNSASWIGVATWNTDGTFSRTTVTVNKNSTYNHDYVFLSTVAYVRISYRTSNSETMSYTVFHYTEKEVISLRNSVENNNAEVPSIRKQPFYNALTEAPCYDHLFVNRFGSMCTIPAESVHHIRISSSIGFNVIELHPQATATDGVYIVNHLEGGTFGRYFHHVDGTTDISAIKPADKTWQWIEENVRYNSQFPKYQTRPTTLEEALSACKVHNIIPLMKIPNSYVRDILDTYMGKNQYIVYDGTRMADGNDAFIFVWETIATKEEIVEYCQSIGAPLLYGISNVASFTEETLQDIIKTLHGMGIYTAVSYEGDNWYKYRRIGVDAVGAVLNTNRLQQGNTYNLSTLTSTSDFTVTGGTVSENVITLADEGTITCANIDSNKRQLARVDLEVVYSGSLKLTDGLGEFRGDRTYSSATGNLIISTAVINGKINFTLTAVGAVTITDINYKVSVLG
jgi:hypothetical protein